MPATMKPPFGARLNLGHPMARDLIGCWLFNEGSGNKVYDYSGQNNHGTFAGAVPFPDPPTSTRGWNGGIHGGGLLNNGSTAYVDCGPSVGGATLGPNLTVITWVKSNVPDGVIAQYISICKQGFAAATGFQIYCLNYPPLGGVLLDTFSASTYNRYVFTHDRDWHQFATVYQYFLGAGVTGSTYKDGVLMTPFATGMATLISQNTHNLWIGQRDETYANWNIGITDSVFIYNRAFSASEVAFSYAFPFSMFEDPGHPEFYQKHGGFVSWKLI